MASDRDYIRSSGGVTTQSRLRSVPVHVHWHGFESDTYRMQQAGWSISAIEDPMNRRMRLAFARDGDPGSNGYPNKLRGITSEFEWDHFWMHQGASPPRVIAEVQAVGSRIHIHERQRITERLWTPIDATPQMWAGEITSLDDHANFIPAGNVRQEIIVAEPEVEALLAKILEMQQPAKVARATEAMYEARKSGLLVPKVHAQIVSLTDFKAA